MHSNDDKRAVEPINIDLAFSTAAAVHGQRPNPDRAHVRQGHRGRVDHTPIEHIENDSARLRRFRLTCPVANVLAWLIAVGTPCPPNLIYGGGKLSIA